MLKGQVNGPLPKRGGGSKPEYPEKKTDNQTENRYHITLEMKIHRPQPTLDSKHGDRLAWSVTARRLLYLFFFCVQMLVWSCQSWRWMFLMNWAAVAGRPGGF